jgi:hypothetical protein
MRGSLLYLVSAALAAVFAAAPPASAGGTITTNGAAIDSGTAPVKGTVTVDPSAPVAAGPALPSVGPLGTIGTISGGIPSFVAGGGATAFVASPPTQTMPGGVYSYSTFNVPQGATLTYTGAVTIQTAGDVQIDGQVTTTAAGASVTFTCGGNFRVISHAGAITTGIFTTGLGSAISIDVNGAISTSTADTSTSGIDAVSGPVSLLTHSGGPLLALASTTVRSRSAGNTLVQAAGGIAVPASTIRADVGDVTLQAYNGGVSMGQGTALTAGNNLLVESTGAVNANGAVQISGTNTATVTAFGGSVTVVGSSMVQQTGGTGDVAIRASGGVTLAGTSVVQLMGTGNIGITAFGGNLSVEAAGSAAASTVRNFSGPSRSLSLLASDDVIVAGSSLIQCDNGSVSVQSTMGSISLRGDSAVIAPTGSVDARAATGFTAQSDAAVSAALFPSIGTQSLLVRAGTAGIALTSDPITTSAGGLTLIASGNVDVNANLTANGTISVQSTQGNVDVSGQTLVTGAAGLKSGDVLIESYGGSSATIDATNAAVHSGNDANASGDVTLKVYAGAAVTTAGSLVPKQVKVTLKKKDLTQSKLAASGVIDTGPDAIDLTGDGTLTVGTLTFPVNLAADKAGRPTYRGGGAFLRLTPSKVGSSKTAFTLEVIGDFRGMLDDVATGELTFSFTHGALDARGTVRLQAGLYVRSKRRATLVQPTLYVASAKATLKDVGKDRLDLVAGFSTDGTTPQTAPETTVAFGDSFSVTFPAASFKHKSGTSAFTAGDATTGASIVVDYKKETVTFHAVKATIGTLPAGLVIQMRAAVTLGTDARAADIRVAHRGTTLAY